MRIRPLNAEEAEFADKCIGVVLVASGMFHSSPKEYYTLLPKALFWVMAVQIGTACICQKIFSTCGRLIQTSPNAQKEHVKKELIDTFWGMGLVVASAFAWLFANIHAGKPTGFTKPTVDGYELNTLDDCFPFIPGFAALPDAAKVALYIVKIVVVLLAADFYNYWKHRAFHDKWLWSFHKSHHAHHNPSALGGYAVSILYGLTTFGPMYFFVLPIAGMYLPLHAPPLVFFYFLNHYLHCGYTVDALERMLQPFYIISSAWHNYHHEKGRQGVEYKEQTFSEMFIFWDLYYGTHVKGREVSY